MQRVLRTILCLMLALAPLSASAGVEALSMFDASPIGSEQEQASMAPMEGGCAGTPCMATCTYAACAVSTCSLQHTGIVNDAMPLAAAIHVTVADTERPSDGRRLLPDKPPPRA